jgi:tRNA (cytidine32/uridine32-2'-O)-methyltransferase
MTALKNINARNATNPGPLRAEPIALQQVRIVLVDTLYARNIGAAARAMKVMGLKRLYLVRPQSYPDKQATDLAAGAADVLANATVVAELSAALAGCTAVYGASARRRLIPVPEFTPRQCAEHAAQVLASAADDTVANTALGDIALVFGPEPAGLDNASLDRCQYLVQVPANPEYPSLNLAAAVQILTYELRLAVLAAPVYQPRHLPAPNEDFDAFFQHLLSTAEAANYFGNKNVAVTSAQLRRMFLRLEGSTAELKMLRGLLSQLQHRMGNR